MGIYQIPRYLLPHSVNVKTELTHDEWGNRTFRTDTLSYVRVVKSNVSEQRKNDRRDDSDALMYFDLQNSIPNNFAFSTGQTVEFDGESYEIGGIKSVVSTAHLHHLEIKLYIRRNE